MIDLLITKVVKSVSYSIPNYIFIFQLPIEFDAIRDVIIIDLWVN